MNKKISEKLWLTANKVRGAFEMSELCKLMVCTLFLKYVELKKKQDENVGILSTYDEKYSLGYLALTYGKMVDSSDLAAYIAMLEKEFQLEGAIVANEFERVLNKADVESVKIIFDAVEQTDLKVEQLYEAALTFLNWLIHTNGRSGECFTNLSLCKLEAKLLDCQDGMTVYDGFCGSGISANEVADNKGIVYLQDINASMLAYATILTLLKGNKIGAIRCGDSQLNPLSANKFDRVVSEPPFVQKYIPEYFSSIPEGNCIYQEIQSSESLALRHSLAHLKEDGVAVVLVPSGFLFKSGRGASVREKMISEYIDAVIELPSGVFYPYAAVATALLVLKKKKTENYIYMINAKDFFKKTTKSQAMITDENIDRIIELYQSRESIEGISHNTHIKAIEENGYNLCTTQYVTQTPEDTITIEDTSYYMKKYIQLADQLAEIDKQLGAVRSRFTKEA